MSGQDVGFFDVGGECPDLVIENGDLKADNGLENAALISMYSDKRISLEELPANTEDRRGWWADQIAELSGDEIGSKVWRIEVLGKVNNQTAVDMKSAIEDAFAWMIEDGVAKSIEVTSTRTNNSEISSQILITKPDGDAIPYKYIWDGQRSKLTEE